MRLTLPKRGIDRFERLRVAPLAQQPLRRGMEPRVRIGSINTEQLVGDAFPPIGRKRALVELTQAQNQRPADSHVRLVIDAPDDYRGTHAEWAEAVNQVAPGADLMSA